MYIALTILQLLSALAVTVIVLFQSGKRSGLSGAIAGGADTFLSKGKAKQSVDPMSPAAVQPTTGQASA